MYLAVDKDAPADFAGTFDTAEEAQRIGRRMFGASARVLGVTETGQDGDRFDHFVAMLHPHIGLQVYGPFDGSGADRFIASRNRESGYFWSFRPQPAPKLLQETEKVRERLIGRLVEEAEYRYDMDLENLLKAGFMGFKSMTDGQLLTNYRSKGLAKLNRDYLDDAMTATAMPIVLGSTNSGAVDLTEWADEAEVGEINRLIDDDFHTTLRDLYLDGGTECIVQPATLLARLALKRPAVHQELRP